MSARNMVPTVSVRSSARLLGFSLIACLVQLPASGKEGEPVATLVLKADGSVSYHANSLNAEEIAKLCAELTEKEESPRVLIRADRDLPLSHLKSLVKQLSAGGITNLVFLSLPPAADRKTGTDDLPPTDSRTEPIEVRISEVGNLDAKDLLSACALLAKGVNVRLTCSLDKPGAEATVTILDPMNAGEDLMSVHLAVKEIRVNEEAVTAEVLREKLEQLREGALLVEVEPRIYLQAEQGVAIAALFEIFDLCSNKGISLVPLVANEQEAEVPDPVAKKKLE